MALGSCFGHDDRLGKCDNAAESEKGRLIHGLHKSEERECSHSCVISFNRHLKL